jgi:hypothetical protein
MSGFTEYQLQYVAKIQSVKIGKKSGGIEIDLEGIPEFVVYLIPEEVQHSLLERIIPGLDVKKPFELQSIDAAQTILNQAKEQQLYLCVFMGKLFGMKVYQLRTSHVPHYAYRAYHNLETTEQEKNQLIVITKLLESHREFFDEGYGKYVALVNGNIVQAFFHSIEEIPRKSTDRVLTFCVGVVGGHQSTLLFRTVAASSRRNCPVLLYHGLVMPVTMSSDGGLIDSTQSYLVDTGVDETMLPGK